MCKYSGIAWTLASDLTWCHVTTFLFLYFTLESTSYHTFVWFANFHSFQQIEKALLGKLENIWWKYVVRHRFFGQGYKGRASRDGPGKSFGGGSIAAGCSCASERPRSHMFADGDQPHAGIAGKALQPAQRSCTSRQSGPVTQAHHPLTKASLYAQTPPPPPSPSPFAASPHSRLEVGMP